MLRTVALLGAALLLAGCGGGSATEQPLGQITAGGRPAGEQDPACSTTATTDPLPSIYPDALMLPEGAVVTSSQERLPIATIAGSVPGDLDTVRAQFKVSIDAAALPIQSDDYEGFEAEYFFGTLALQGVLRVVEQPCLPGRTAFALSLQSNG